MKRTTWSVLCSVFDVRRQWNHPGESRLLRTLRCALEYAVAVAIALLSSYAILRLRW